MRDGKNDINRLEVLTPAAPGLSAFFTSAVTVASNSKITLSVGCAGSAAGIFELQESATLGGSYTTVASDEVIGTQGVALVVGSIRSLGYLGNLGFVKGAIDLSVDGITYAYAEEAGAAVTPNTTN